MSTCILDPGERSAYLCPCRPFGFVSCDLHFTCRTKGCHVTSIFSRSSCWGGCCCHRVWQLSTITIVTFKKKFRGPLLEKSFISAVCLPDYTEHQLVDSSLKYGTLNLGHWKVGVLGAAAPPIGKRVVTLPEWKFTSIIALNVPTLAPSWSRSSWILIKTYYAC